MCLKWLVFLNHTPKADRYVVRQRSKRKYHKRLMLKRDRTTSSNTNKLLYAPSQTQSRRPTYPIKKSTNTCTSNEHQLKNLKKKRSDLQSGFYKTFRRRSANATRVVVVVVCKSNRQELETHEKPNQIAPQTPPQQRKGSSSEKEGKARKAGRQAATSWLCLPRLTACDGLPSDRLQSVVSG